MVNDLVFGVVLYCFKGRVVHDSSQLPFSGIFRCKIDVFCKKPQLLAAKKFIHGRYTVVYVQFFVNIVGMFSNGFGA